MLRTALGLGVALALAVAMPAVAGGGSKKVSVGDYQASPTGDLEDDYSVGVFSVERSAGQRQVVATEGYLGIYYPDAGECDDLDVPIDAGAIAVAPTGRFTHRERTVVEDSAVKVVWKGRWTKPGVVRGSITLRYEGCSSTRKWAGGKVG